jgi:hypothetical protein
MRRRSHLRQRRHHPGAPGTRSSWPGRHARSIEGTLTQELHAGRLDLSGHPLIRSARSNLAAVVRRLLINRRNEVGRGGEPTRNGVGEVR